MPRSCPVCKHPDGAKITHLVLTGKLSVSEAARELGVPYHVMWHHLNRHVSPSGSIVSDALNPEDIHRILAEITWKLKDFVDTMFAEGNISAGIIRELRGLLRDATELAGRLETGSDTCEEQLDEILRIVLDELTPLQRQRIATRLEKITGKNTASGTASG